MPEQKCKGFLTALVADADQMALAAKERGCTTVDGLGMLLHQAAPGFERWFGTRPDVTNETRLAVLK